MRIGWLPRLSSLRDHYLADGAFFSLSRLPDRFSPSHTKPGSGPRTGPSSTIPLALALQEVYNGSNKLRVGICRLGAALLHSIN